MTQKVQKFAFQFPECRNLMSNGRIRPMNTQLFICITEAIFQYFSPKLILNNSNYSTEIPNLAKIFGYKGKIDRNMLITVNAPHTYPNVIAFLAWFLEIQEMARALDIDLLFRKFDDEPTLDEDEDLAIDFAELFPHLTECYHLHHENKSLHAVDNAYHRKLIEKLEFNDEDLLETHEQLQGKYSALQENLDLEELQRLEEVYRVLTEKNDAQEQYYEKTKEYIVQVDEQHAMTDHECNNYEKRIEETDKDIELLNLAVKNQQLSLEDKERLAKENSELATEIGLLEAQMKSFQDILYTEQIQFSKTRNKVGEQILEYNKSLIENINIIPNADQLKLGTNILNKDVTSEHQMVDSVLTTLINDTEQKKNTLMKQMKELEGNTKSIEMLLEKVNEQYYNINNDNTILVNEIEEIRKTHQMEVDQLQKDMQNIEDQLESIKLNKPSVIESQKKLDKIKAEIKALSDLRNNNLKNMKIRITHANAIYKELFDVTMDCNNRKNAVLAEHNKLKAELRKKAKEFILKSKQSETS